MTPTDNTPRVQPKGLEFGSLTGKLAKRPAAARVASEPTQPSPPATRPAGAAPEDQPQPAEARENQTQQITPVGEGPTTRLVGGRPGRRRVAFTLPADLRDALGSRGRASSQAEVIFDAIEAHLDDIPELLNQAASLHSGGLFERSRREPQQHRVPTTVWMSVQNVAQIDDLAATHGAETRTQLLEVVLRRYLQPAP